MNNSPFSFKGAKIEGDSELPSVAAKGIFSTEAGSKMLSTSYWSVTEPLELNDAIPRALSAASTNQKSLGAPVSQSFNLFESFELATKWAQRQNRPLVIMEIKPSAKVVPVLPQVEKIG